MIFWRISVLALGILYCWVIGHAVYNRINAPDEFAEWRAIQRYPQAPTFDPIYDVVIEPENPCVGNVDHGPAIQKILNDVDDLQQRTSQAAGDTFPA